MYGISGRLGVLLVSIILLVSGSSSVSAEDSLNGNFSTEDMAKWIAQGVDLNSKNVADWKTVESVQSDPKDEKKLTSKAGSGVLINGDQGRTRNLLSIAQHGDVQAHIEFLVPKGSNSGVYFQGRYEVQILDSWGKKDLKYGDCGGIYHSPVKKSSGSAPKVNASRPPGKWQTFDVTFRAPRFDKDGRKTADALFVKVVHNGKVVQENVSVPGPTVAAAFGDEKPMGPILLQGDHGPVAYRNIVLKPIAGD